MMTHYSPHTRENKGAYISESAECRTTLTPIILTDLGLLTICDSRTSISFSADSRVSGTKLGLIHVLRHCVGSLGGAEKFEPRSGGEAVDEVGAPGLYKVEVTFEIFVSNWIVNQDEPVPKKVLIQGGVHEAAVADSHLQ